MDCGREEFSIFPLGVFTISCEDFSQNRHSLTRAERARKLRETVYFRKKREKIFLTLPSKEQSFIYFFFVGIDSTVYSRRT